MSDKLDPRTNAYRPDLANAALKDKVTAARYVDGTPAWVVTSSAPLRNAPRFDAPLDTEALLGQPVTVFDDYEGWSWAQLQADNYVGYIPSDSLSLIPQKPTHKVCARRTFLFPAPDIKTPPLMALPLNTEVQITGQKDNFFERKQGGYLHHAHIRPLGQFDQDFVSVAERFLDTPYLWGGRQDIGIDCSGLVQISLEAAGISAPRDSDMQSAGLGTALSIPQVLSALARGDLIFWKGHVGIMRDETKLLHANAYHMKTTSEPLQEAVRRIKESGNEITTIRRL